MHVHGDNLRGKIDHTTKYQDADSRRYLKEIEVKYAEWKKANEELKGPTAVPTEEDAEILTNRTALLRDYKAFLDQKVYAEKFDSRSNLHSSILEEFLYFLFRDLVLGFGEHALIGKSHSFKDLFFVPPSYQAMIAAPHARIEIKDHDFVIGATVLARFASVDADPEGGEDGLGVVEDHRFDLPAVAIECKTYLDKTMLEGASRSADEIKGRNPNGMYFVLCERLKLSGAVNLRKFSVDQIYVLRKEKNVDREYRLEDGYEGNDIKEDVVIRLFDDVRTTLTSDWETELEAGIKRGWLL